MANEYFFKREFGIDLGSEESQKFATDHNLARYFCILQRVLEADGISPAEAAFLAKARAYAELSPAANAELDRMIASGDDLDSLVASLGDIGPVLKKHLFRDVVRAVLADEEYTPAEEKVVARISKALGLEAPAVSGIFAWVQESRALALKWDSIGW